MWRTLQRLVAWQGLNILSCAEFLTPAASQSPLMPDPARVVVLAFTPGGRRRPSVEQIQCLMSLAFPLPEELCVSNPPASLDVASASGTGDVHLCEHAKELVIGVCRNEAEFVSIREASTRPFLITSQGALIL